MCKYIVRIGFVGFIVFMFTSCALVNNIQGLKRDVMASINYNENKKLNTIQMQKQLQLYKQNFSYDKVAQLNYINFDSSMGQTGLWIPMKFIETVGGGVYFLNSLNYDKPPIVFVHGAGGNPREWTTIVQELENDFQIIVVSYASGMRLSQSSQVIYEALSFLIDKYKFEYMPIVAHSMGGLVMKDVLSHMTEKELQVVQKFVTISTPWNGDKLATRSSTLDYSLPYWVDMRPNSLFLKELNSKNIPKSVKHYLFFGYKGKLTLTAGINNDGVISLNSQLKQERQDNAYKVFGYNETHVSILRSQELINNIHQIVVEK